MNLKSLITSVLVVVVGVIVAKFVSAKLKIDGYEVNYEQD